MVEIRAVVVEDLPAHYAQQADPESRAMAGVPGRDRAAFDAHWAKITADPLGRVRSIVEDDEVVGSIVAWDSDAGREVGYWIDRDHWGRGLASTALELFLAEESVRPLLAHIEPNNAASLRVLEKNGFVVVARTDDSIDLLLS